MGGEGAEAPDTLTCPDSAGVAPRAPVSSGRLNGEILPPPTPNDGFADVAKLSSLPMKAIQTARPYDG